MQQNKNQNHLRGSTLHLHKRRRDLDWTKNHFQV